jgi:hypothetical protein
MPHAPTPLPFPYLCHLATQIDNQSSADFSAVKLVLERRLMLRDSGGHIKDMTECVVQSVYAGMWVRLDGPGMWNVIHVQ